MIRQIQVMCFLCIGTFCCFPSLLARSDSGLREVDVVDGVFEIVKLSLEDINLALKHPLTRKTLCKNMQIKPCQLEKARKLIEEEQAKVSAKKVLVPGATFLFTALSTVFVMKLFNSGFAMFFNGEKNTPSRSISALEAFAAGAFGLSAARFVAGRENHKELIKPYPSLQKYSIKFFYLGSDIDSPRVELV